MAKNESLTAEGADYAENYEPFSANSAISAVILQR
jgi:hypothetical protein